MINFKETKVIQLNQWDKLVQETYGRTYSFQQQEGCQPRGVVNITVPCKEDAEYMDNEMRDSIIEKVNGPEMGVKFKSWLERDPKQPIKNQEYDYQLDLFWSRNFYPALEVVAQDLYEKGLLPEGEYMINIDW